MKSTRRRRLLWWLLIALTLEKILQHIIVSWAFATDRFGIRDSVVVDYRWLTIIGGLIAVLFGVALVGLVRRRYWSLTLLIVLALADIVGEFIAQGTFGIVITVSFVVAIAILIISRIQQRSLRAAANGIAKLNGQPI